MDDEIPLREILTRRNVRVGQEKVTPDVVAALLGHHAGIGVEIRRRRALPAVGVVQDDRLGNGLEVHLVLGDGESQGGARRDQQDGVPLGPVGGAHSHPAVERSGSAAEAWRFPAHPGPFHPISRRGIADGGPAHRVLPVPQPLAIRVQITVVTVDCGAVALAARASGHESFVAGDDLAEHVPGQSAVLGYGDGHRFVGFPLFVIAALLVVDQPVEDLRSRNRRREPPPAVGRTARRARAKHHLRAAPQRNRRCSVDGHGARVGGKAPEAAVRQSDDAYGRIRLVPRGSSDHHRAADPQLDAFVAQVVRLGRAVDFMHDGEQRRKTHDAGAASHLSERPADAAEHPRVPRRQRCARRPGSCGN